MILVALADDTTLLTDASPRRRLRAALLAKPAKALFARCAARGCLGLTSFCAYPQNGRSANLAPRRAIRSYISPARFIYLVALHEILGFLMAIGGTMARDTIGP